MAAGIVLGVVAYLISHRTNSSFTQGDAITIAVGGATLAVTGSALFLRYSLTGFLRFWMARQSFEMNLLAEKVFAGGLLSAGDGALDASNATVASSAPSGRADS
jgi:hypothetical protein